MGWGWYFLFTVLDDYSRFIISWDLRSKMTSKDVMPSLENALQFAIIKENTAPMLLSDNGKCYLSSEHQGFLAEKGIKPINGKPCHPQIQGKIECYHRSMKNVIRLDNYYSPDDLIQAIAEFVEYYNNRWYHESLNNLTPADVYFNRDKRKLRERLQIKEETIKQRRKNYIDKKLELIYETI
jgi:putative transposase